MFSVRKYCHSAFAMLVLIITRVGCLLACVYSLSCCFCNLGRQNVPYIVAVQGRIWCGGRHDSMRDMVWGCFVINFIFIWRASNYGRTCCSCRAQLRKVHQSLRSNTFFNMGRMLTFGVVRVCEERSPE